MALTQRDFEVQVGIGSTLKEVGPRPPAFPVAAERSPQPPPRPGLVAAPVAAPPSPSPSGYLDSGTKIKGKLSFEGTVRIDGHVEGEITAKQTVWIGSGAMIVANIVAATVIIEGSVNGDITATQRIELRPSAKVLGDLTSPGLTTHEGAQFEGHCSMKLESAEADNERPDDEESDTTETQVQGLLEDAPTVNLLPVEHLPVTEKDPDSEETVAA